MSIRSARRPRTHRKDEDKGIEYIHHGSASRSSLSSIDSSDRRTIVSSSRKRAPKPNRQRCREFRERKKVHTEDLQARVDALRQEVSELVAKKSLYMSTLLLKRHTSFGSLERMIREYVSVFRYGVAMAHRDGSTTVLDPTRVHAKVQSQREFMHHLIHPSSQYGESFGPDASFAQWCYFTAAYPSFIGEAHHIEMSGTEDDPIVICHAVYDVVVTRSSFQYLFPHALSNEGLVQRFLGLRVSCPIVINYQFAPNGQVIKETGDIGLYEGFVNAGCCLDDVAEMLGSCVVLSEGRVPDEYIQLNECDAMKILDPTGPPKNDNESPTTQERLSLSYLLADDNEGGGEEEETKSDPSSSMVTYYSL